MSLARRVEVPANRLWEAITSLFSPDNHDREALAARYNFGLRIDGRGVGQKMYLEIRDPKLLGVTGTIVERLEEWDSRRRLVRYRIVDNGPLPVTDVLLSYKVTAHGPRASSYRYEAEYTPVTSQEEEARKFFTTNWIFIKDNVTRSAAGDSQGE